MSDKNRQPLFSLNLRGRLVEYDRPVVMGIINVTPDSFYSRLRAESEHAIAERTEAIIAEGVDIIDLGGCSTRPDSIPADIDDEMRRVETGLRVIKSITQEIPVSIDTFRARVASRAVDMGADIINDVTGLSGDKDMRRFVIESRLPYILTHGVADPLPPDMRGNDVATAVICSLEHSIAELTQEGVADIIVDPGFGFGKSVSQCYDLMQRLELFGATGCPVLAGISRKSMIYKPLDCTPAGALAGTCALNTIAIGKGAAILRVHDVKAARDVITAALLTL